MVFGFFLKQTTAIASLVGLATNEQVCFSTLSLRGHEAIRHFTTFSQAKAVIVRRHEAIRHFTTFSQAKAVIVRRHDAIRHFTTFSQAKAVIARRHDEAICRV